MRMTVILAAALTSACVTTGTYDRKVGELTKLREADVAASQARERTQAAQLEEANKHHAEQLATVQAALDKASAEEVVLQKQVDDDTQLVATLKQRLEKVGQNVDNLVKERGQLTQTMAETNARLEDLRKQKAAADARVATFRGLVTKLRSMIDTGQLKVVIRNGRMIIALPNDILFDSGRTDVKPAGRLALAKVAQVLGTVSDRDFLVAGHTDDLPIRTSQFPSNWELSTRRAVEVVHFLITQGMRPKVLAAAGYGEFDPAVPNNSAEHRAQNRRIEIVLQPNLSDLPPLDDASLAAPGAAPAK